MESIYIAGCLGRAKKNITKLMAKKTGLTKKITEYIQVIYLSEIDPEFLAATYGAKPSSVKRVLASLSKKGLVRKSGDKWLIPSK